jgi:hypothetical protein
MKDMRPAVTLPQLSPRGAFWLGLMLLPTYVLVILALLADASMRVAGPASLLAWPLAVLSFAIGAGIFLPDPRRWPWLLRGWLGLSLVLPLGLAVLPWGGWPALGVASAGVLVWSVLCLAAHRMGGAEVPVQTFALPLNRAANPLAWRHFWAGAALLLAGIAAMAATEHLLGERLRSAALPAALALVPLGVLLAPRAIPGRMLGGTVPLAQWFVFEATAVDRGLLGGAPDRPDSWRYWSFHTVRGLADWTSLGGAAPGLGTAATALLVGSLVWLAALGAAALAAMVPDR